MNVGDGEAAVGAAACGTCGAADEDCSCAQCPTESCPPPQVATPNSDVGDDEEWHESMGQWLASGGGQIPAGHTGQPPVESAPTELLVAILSLVDPKTLLLSVPAVCRRWRRACPLIPAVNLDLTFLPRGAAMRRAVDSTKKVRWFVGLFTRHPLVRHVILLSALLSNLAP